MHSTAAGDIWFWGLALAIAALTSLYLGFRNLKRARTIEDTPTARVRSAHQGYVELSGTARLMENDEMRAPLTGAPCCWWRYRVETKQGKHWKTLDSGASDALFLLDDGDGLCILDPEGAEITPADRSIWHGGSRRPGNRNPKRVRITGRLFNWGGGVHLSIGLGGFRYTEERLYAGEPIYAIGHFKTLDDVDHGAARSELQRAILADWKHNQAQLMQRFDRNGDGHIDAREWELARRTAYHQAKREYQARLEKIIPHTLSRPRDRRQPFLVSALEEFGLVRRHKRHAVFGLAGFFLAGGAAAWLFAQL